MVAEESPYAGSVLRRMVAVGIGVVSVLDQPHLLVAPVVLVAADEVGAVEYRERRQAELALELLAELVLYGAVAAVLDEAFHIFRAFVAGNHHGGRSTH